MFDPRGDMDIDEIPLHIDPSFNLNESDPLEPMVSTQMTSMPLPEPVSPSLQPSPKPEVLSKPKEKDLKKEKRKKKKKRDEIDDIFG